MMQPKGDYRLVTSTYEAPYTEEGDLNRKQPLITGNLLDCFSEDVFIHCIHVLS